VQCPVTTGDHHLKSVQGLLVEITELISPDKSNKFMPVLVWGVTRVARWYQREKGFYERTAGNQITASSIQSALRTRYEEVMDGNDQWRCEVGLDRSRRKKEARNQANAEFPCSKSGKQERMERWLQ